MRIRGLALAFLDTARVPWSGLLGATVDGRNPFRTAQETQRNVDSAVNTNKRWFPMVSTWCRISSIHSRNSCESCKSGRDSPWQPVLGCLGLGGVFQCVLHPPFCPFQPSRSEFPFGVIFRRAHIGTSGPLVGSDLLRGGHEGFCYI